MLERLSRFVIRRPKMILGLTAGFLAFSAVFGGGVADKLTAGGFADPNSEAEQVKSVIKDNFGSSNTDLVLLVATKTKGSTVDDAQIAKVGRALNAELEAQADVEQVVSYWTLDNAPPLKSADGTRAMVLANITGTENGVSLRVEELTKLFSRETADLKISVGGPAAVYSEMGKTIESDLIRSESIAIPITIILLVFVFGSLVAASLPLAVGGLTVLGTFAVLQILTSFTDVSIFALNLTTGMGLGLAIDYSLLILSRFREELANGAEVEDAVAKTVSTAGRTVIFSGVTVAISIASLLVFPTVFLRSFAYAGIAVGVIAVLGAIVALPAILALLGHSVDKAMLWRRSAQTTDEGFWRRVATSVMRRPLIAGLSVAAVLVVAGTPFLDLEFGVPDDRVLPESASTRQVSDELRKHFGVQEAGALTVLAELDAGEIRGDGAGEIIDSYATRISGMKDVARVDASTGSYANGTQVLPHVESIHGKFVASGEAQTWLSVIPAVEPLSPEGEKLVNEIRAIETAFPVRVGGGTAQFVDDKEVIMNRLPIALSMIAVTTLVLLFVMFGSVVIPIKALLMNTLSLSATFGSMVFIFQQGHFADLLNFTPTGTLEIGTPLMMFCLAFGLSMDYEVFLLSRIKEEYDRTGDNTHSVAIGLQRTGRIVTAAALLISVVFGSFITSGVSTIKLLGLGMTLAILVDATLVRGILVPAFMRLAGDFNWWAPAPLRALHARIGISESV